MPFSKTFPLLLAFQVLSLVTCSLVQLKNNGYEDLVIAINPRLPEDSKIIDSIKKMVIEASPYLFHATQKRAYFKTVKILVPLTWTPYPNYARPRTESYEKADVIIADPFIKYGDDPYTLQYGRCGEPGKHIHFTTNFLTNDSVLPVYGSRGRVLVHEWAHLRWGVFDEYNSDRPFYISRDVNGNAKIEATRCSKAVQGSHKYIDCNGMTCSLRPCQRDTSTGLYEDGCIFLPETIQNTAASIMYMQALSTVVEFCDLSTHNVDAPNLQNRMCKSNSTWDVIMRSKDWTSNPPMNSTAPPSVPTFSLLQSGDRVICLVLDVSGSMDGFDRLNRMRQAAELFLLQIIEQGSHVGIVTFSSAANIISQLRQITNDNVRKDLVSLLPKSAGGGTTICAGVKMGFQVNKGSGATRNTSGTEIVLLTDGEDSGASSCLTEVESSGAVIHSIALGPSADKAVDAMADKTGGFKFYAPDNLDSNGLIDAFSGISSGSGNLAQQSIQLESEAANVGNGQCFYKTMAIDSTVGNDTFFVVTWTISYPSINLVDPNTKIYTNSDFKIDSTTRTARLQIPGTAQAGIWSYSLCNTASTEQAFSMTVTSRAAKDGVDPVTVKAHMNTDVNASPTPMVVYAEVSQGYLPVLEANVTAIIEPENGKAVILHLDDNGAGADTSKDDGIYSRYFIAYSTNGRYNLKVVVQGRDKTTRLGLRVKRSHALYIPGYVHNGVATQINPPRPVVPDDDIQAKLESFSRSASGGSFTVTNVSPGSTDIYPPSTITDLAARILDKKVDLSWTAPGDDLDQGQASSYDIRMSTNPLELRDNFDRATTVNASTLTPQFAGSAESFSFVPENLELANGTIIYFAVRAVDNSSLQSDVSNTAQAAIFLPPRLNPTTPVPPVSDSSPSTTTSTPVSPNSESSPSYNVTVVVVIVCCTVLLITLIISITLCILSCHRSKRPQSEM